MNPTVTVNPSLCWSPLQRTTNSALHKSVFSSAPCATYASSSPRVVLDDIGHDSVASKVPGMSSKSGTGVGVYGVAAVPARRPAAQVAAGDSTTCEDETSAVAAAIRLLESHQLLQQVALPLIRCVLANILPLCPATHCRIIPCLVLGSALCRAGLHHLQSTDLNFIFAGSGPGGHARALRQPPRVLPVSSAALTRVHGRLRHAGTPRPATATCAWGRAERRDLRLGLMSRSRARSRGTSRSR